jgi:hypothetical protein
VELTDDIVRGMEPGTLSNLIAPPILAVQPFGTLVLFSVILPARGLRERLPWRTTAQHKQGAPA